MGNPLTDENELLTDEVVDAWLKRHENDPVDEARMERFSRRVLEAVGIDADGALPPHPRAKDNG